ncbi:PepSY domain-containing protein [Vibrio sp. WXL210]|uniref:PepSY domain-containing protein n=1 Tax=Vibrio sp. WXL210 TaxID=3450709 RepID=UPI003EC903BD
MNPLNMKPMTTAILISTLGMSGYTIADDDTRFHVLALESSNTSIESLSPAVRELINGVITEVELDDHRDEQVAYQFEWVDLDEQSHHKVSYAVNDLTVLEQKTSDLSSFGFSKINKDEQVAIQEVAKAQFDILSVIPKLEEKYAAKLVEAELETKNGLIFYEVKLASTETGKHKLLVDVASGEEIPMLKKQRHQ